jgi:hypothetical protein
MKKTVLFFSFMLVAVLLQAQAVMYDMIPFRKDSLWGFADITRTVLIEPQYDEIKLFRDEITAVRKNDKWGFIDTHGKAVTPFKYDLAGNFKEGMCQVKTGTNSGYVNSKGKEAVKPAYQFSEEFSEGLAVVSNFVKGNLVSSVIDRNGKVVLSDLNTASGTFHSGYLAVREQSKTHFIDKNGKRLKMPEGAEIYFEFSEDAAIVMLREKKSNADTTAPALYLGVMDKNGKLSGDTVRDVFGNKIVLSSTQRVISNFVHGFAIVQRTPIETLSDSNSEYAFFDHSGKMSMWFSAVRAFSDDGRSIVVATSDSIPKVIDTKFRTVPPSITFSDAGTFSEGMLRIKLTPDGKWGFINSKGEIVIDMIYDECSDFSGGIAAVVYNGKPGFINKNGLQFWQN